MGWNVVPYLHTNPCSSQVFRIYGQVDIINEIGQGTPKNCVIPDRLENPCDRYQCHPMPMQLELRVPSTALLLTGLKSKAYSSLIWSQFMAIQWDISGIEWD